MVGWLLNLAYVLLLLAVSPVLIWRMVTQGKYRDGWREKFLGLLPCSEAGERVVWLHAVSVGEVLQLRTIVAELAGRHPGLTILISTTTVTGRAVAEESFPQCRIAYCPLDFTWAVRTALRRVRPVCIGLVELELWPNLIREASASGATLMLINGRMSPRSHRGYRRARRLIMPLLQRLHVIAVQTEEYAARLIDLGAPARRVHVTGSIKFDGVCVDGLTEQTAALRSAFGIAATDRVFIAGSTHDPEEMVALDAWQQLRVQHPELRLVLVPRHRERFDEVAARIEVRGLRVRRRSQAMSTESIAPGEACEVCLLDTLGELSACWGLADIAFVGGSLTRRGGQNMIEPAAYGIPVVVGPNTVNFRDVVEGLRSVDGIQVIDSATGLAAAVDGLLTDQTGAERMGRAARGFVEAQQGATRRTLDHLARLLPTAVKSVDRRAA